jgi:hypothetical protein
MTRSTATVFQLACLAFLVPSPARADLRFQQPAVSLGSIKAGEPLAHTFAFVNDGPGEVEITNARASCGCLVPRLDRRLYPAGAAGELRFEVNTLTQAEGPHTWTIDVSYQDGTKPREVRLELTATVVAEVRVQPSTLIMAADQVVAHEVVLTDRRPQPLSVTAVETSSPRLRARWDGGTREAGAPWVGRIHVEIAADCPAGRHDEVLSIYTTDPVYQHLKVPVTVVKRSRQRLSATPGQVSLTAPAGGAIPSRIVLLRDRDDQAVEVQRVVAADPAVRCKWSKGPNNMATLKISVDRAALAGRTQLRTAVRVEVAGPAAEAIMIPVVCSVE